ncbi:hypothetical protein J2751_001769 [Halorubrum alkaliphilum]|uniref:Uncharacterized protein n=1 Tax=Halorubrum alkaliphilum TaxID=261290 RepID=A0A8T4GIB5_9EURY|nr:hypothetical protein [Halorubrum alkaliphilum]MBP1922755.1 hypothetical protein [Halorubrum alkaliphilum]
MTRTMTADDDAEPIHTSTRVPPVEHADRVYRSTADVDPAPDDEPIAATRVSPAVTRFG